MPPPLPQYPPIPSPAYPMVFVPQFDIKIIKYNDGTKQRILSESEARYEIELRYKFLSQINKNTIYSFFSIRKGSLGIFYITNPLTGIHHIVRFEDDKLKSNFH